MQKLIAIRKESRLENTALQYASTETKREALVQRAITSNRAEDLMHKGFKQVQPPLSIGDTFQALPETGPSFSRLGYLGAYIINVPENLKSVAIAAVEEDYDLISDFELSLPPKVSQNEIQPSPQKRQTSPWSDVSGIKSARENGISGAGVIVGVLDTGCDADHDEFKTRPDGIEFVYVNSQDMNELRRQDQLATDQEGHGTHVSGIIAGKTLGVAPDVDLMVASVIGIGGYKSSLERLMVGLNWMLARFSDDRNLDKPMIINLSLGFPKVSMESNFIEQDQRLKRIFSELLNYDVLPVVAIGNENRDGIRAPGYYASTLSVGAVDSKLDPASFTSYGISPDTNRMQPDLVGYGVNVYSSIRRNKNRTSLYQTDSGTSMAAPYVTGIAALYASENPTLKGNALREKLLETALPLNADPDKVGKGLARYVKGGK